MIRGLNNIERHSAICMVPLLAELKERVPVIFDDIGVESDE